MLWITQNKLLHIHDTPLKINLEVLRTTSDASRVPRDKQQDKHENLNLFSNLKGADVLALFS